MNFTFYKKNCKDGERGKKKKENNRIMDLKGIRIFFFYLQFQKS